MRRGRAAFTLVELLMATTLTGLVLGGAFMSLSVVLRGYKEFSGKSNVSETARLILERMQSDLEAAFLSPHQDTTRFVGMDIQSGDFETDILTFISRIHNPVETGGGSSDLAEIQYYIDQDDTTPERWLLRRYDFSPDMDPFSGGDIALLGPQVVYLDFQYFDGAAWWPDWDSTESVPLAVYLTLGFFIPRQVDDEPTLENIQTFSTTVWIPSARQPAGESLGGTSGGSRSGSGGGSGGRTGSGTGNPGGTPNG